jgi:hypothetical protein
VRRRSRTVGLGPPNAPRRSQNRPMADAAPSKAQRCAPEGCCGANIRQTTCGPARHARRVLRGFSGPPGDPLRIGLVIEVAANRLVLAVRSDGDSRTRGKNKTRDKWGSGLWESSQTPVKIEHSHGCPYQMAAYGLFLVCAWKHRELA